MPEKTTIIIGSVSFTNSDMIIPLKYSDIEIKKTVLFFNFPEGIGLFGLFIASNLASNTILSALNPSIVKERDKIAKIKIGKLNVCSFVSKYADIVLIAVISKYCGTSNSKKVF